METLKPASLKVTALSPDGEFIRVRAYDQDNKPLPFLETGRVGEEYHATSLHMGPEEDAPQVKLEGVIHIGLINTVLSVYHQARDEGYEVSLENIVVEDFGEEGEA